MGPTPDNMNKCCLHTELSSHEGTRPEFNPGKTVIKLGIDVHQEFYVVVVQEGGANPKPAQRFAKAAFLSWAARLGEKSGGAIHAVYEACGFGVGLQRALTGLGIECHVVCPQKLDEQNKRVKTDGLDAKALCLKLDRYVEGNREALALVRIPTEEEEQLRQRYRPQIAAYWKSLREITKCEVEAGIFATATGRFLPYEANELETEWERLRKLPAEGLTAELPRT